MENTSENKSTFLKVLTGVEIGVCGITMGFTIIVIILHVFFRYVLGAPLTWSEELAKMGMIWITFGGSAYAFSTGAHVGITALVDKLTKNNPKRRDVWEIVINVFIFAFFVILLVLGSKAMMNQVGKKSLAAQVPMMIPYASIPFGSLLVLFRIGATIVGLIKKVKANKYNVVEEGGVKA
ncbi:MAG: TRAP transporter small permease [Eubacterium sp.]|nr:TRAP transporter small permease [Eubacterium sp.]